MSNHPIAKSIISKVNKKISQEEIEEYKEIAGMGIKAKYHGDEIVVGNAKLLEKEEIKYYPCNEDITQTDDSNDIFNLIDSMYDEEEDKK